MKRHIFKMKRCILIYFDNFLEINTDFKIKNTQFTDEKTQI